MTPQLNLDFLSFISFNIEFFMQSNSARVIATASMETFVHLLMMKNVVDNVTINGHTIISRKEVSMSNCFHNFNVYTYRNLHNLSW